MSAEKYEGKLRIVIVVTAKVTASSFVLNFAKYIASQGYDVVIIADQIGRSSQSVGEGTFSTIPVAMKRDPHLLRDLQSLVSLTWQLRRIKPDILTYATPKASLLGSIAGVLARVPVRIYQLWGLRLETVRNPMRTILILLEKLTSLLSTRVLANSRSLASKYRELGLCAGRDVDTLGEGSSHGVDVKRFAKNVSYPALDKKTEAHLAEGRGEIVIGFVGRLHRDKGINTLLDAIQLVRAKGVPLNLILVGNDEGVDLDLSGGLQRCVSVVGRVEDPRAYYAAMDFLVLPSLREGFPNVVLEAAAMCVPAIVSDGTGVIDSVVDGETGIVVPVGDPETLAQAICRLAADDQLRERLGAAAGLRAEKFFTQEDVWDMTLAYLTATSGR